MKKIRVGVSGINAADNPGPGTGVARSLKEDFELNVEIIGLAYDAMEPGIYMDWIVDKSFILPYPSGEGDAFLSRLYHIKESHGLDFVIPSLDAELPLYIKYAEALNERGIRTFLPSMQQFKLRGKDLLSEVARKIDIKLPKTVVVNSPSQLEDALEKVGLPAMIKGIYYKAHRAYTRADAHQHMHALAAEWGFPVIVQEIVAGDELNVVGLGDGEGQSLGHVGIKKIMITSLGKIWTGVTVKHEKMLAAAQRFISEYKWRGPFELECIVRNDDVVLIEINPRFPAWSYFATGVGINLPSRMLRRALGMPVPELRDYAAGKLFVRYCLELVSDMEKFQMAVTRGETL
ncbi:MAG TPA: ATP-grasp domain-containing protein [Planctomycetota bacterium]|nr:ATP-grasp domain-containing protein [Planctomycetota bacterium]